jgi:hypothetical protein
MGIDEMQSCERLESASAGVSGSKQSTVANIYGQGRPATLMFTMS